MRYLVIGPASMGVFSQIGILEKLNDRIADVEEISGSSAGAIIGFMLALGMSSEEIASAAFDLDMGNFTVPQFRTFLQRYGFVNTQPIRDQFAKIVGCDPTFAQLDKKLYVAAFCLNDAQTVYFSRDTHPDMKVIDAVIMSMSIPVVFATSMYDGKMYVDGSTTEFHPVAPFYDKRPTDVAVVGVKMSRAYRESIDNPRQFFEALVRASLANRNTNIDPEYALYECDVAEMNIFDFNMDFETKVRLYNMGYESVRD